jgi:hypothetical protein
VIQTFERQTSVTNCCLRKAFAAFAWCEAVYAAPGKRRAHAAVRAHCNNNRGVGNVTYQPHTPTPQLAPRAVVLSIVLATILAAANSYLGLFAGMTIASAIPSAVVSMAVLRALGGGGIL